MIKSAPPPFLPHCVVVLLFVLLCAPSVQADSDTADQRRLDILTFGTETEVAALIQTLRTEGDFSLEKELIEIAENTRNRTILAGVLNFFGEAARSGLEERAIRAIQERDFEANETILAAVDYLGRVNAANAVESLQDLIRSRESFFLNNAIRALGRAARGQEESGVTDTAAEFLLDFYRYRNPSHENQREAIVAIGETGSSTGLQFLIDIISSEDENVGLRIAALEAVAAIGNPLAASAVVDAVASTDPAVRSTAVASLGPFSGAAADQAVLDGFRDSYFRTRQSASRAAGQRQQESAVPFLRFRAENDDVPAVRDEAIRALGAVNNSEAMAALDSLFSARGNSDRVRLMAAEMLLQNNANAYGTKVVVEMDEAQTRRQTALYNGFIRILSTAPPSASFEPAARRLIRSGGVIERALALDLIATNEFRHLADEVRELLDERRSNASLARRARTTLERLGLDEKDDGNE